MAAVVFTVARMLERNGEAELICSAVFIEILYRTTPNTITMVTQTCTEHTAMAEAARTPKLLAIITEYRVIDKISTLFCTVCSVLVN